MQDDEHAGFIFGDRHCCNAIEDKDGRLWQIDADVRIEGPSVREFEICQAIFYSLHALAGQVDGVDATLDFLSSACSDYDLRHVSFFLTRFRSYKAGEAYADGKYASVVPCVSQILDELPA